MFERYTEGARRCLFFARYEASHRGNVSIEKRACSARFDSRRLAYEGNPGPFSVTSREDSPGNRRRRNVDVSGIQPGHYFGSGEHLEMANAQASTSSARTLLMTSRTPADCGRWTGQGSTAPRLPGGSGGSLGRSVRPVNGRDDRARVTPAPAAHLHL